MKDVKCRNNNFPASAQNICTNIYEETEFIINEAKYIPELKDLIMEQIFLCSFLGFEEFLNKKWIAKILEWQMDSGCFSYDNVNCSSHMNGLGAANLAFFGKLKQRNQLN